MILPVSRLWSLTRQSILPWTSRECFLILVSAISYPLWVSSRIWFKLLVPGDSYLWLNTERAFIHDSVFTGISLIGCGIFSMLTITQGTTAWNRKILGVVYLTIDYIYSWFNLQLISSSPQPLICPTVVKVTFSKAF